MPIDARAEAHLNRVPTAQSLGLLCSCRTPFGDRLAGRSWVPCSIIYHAQIPALPPFARIGSGFAVIFSCQGLTVAAVNFDLQGFSSGMKEALRLLSDTKPMSLA